MRYVHRPFLKLCAHVFSKVLNDDKKCVHRHFLKYRAHRVSKVLRKDSPRASLGSGVVCRKSASVLSLKFSTFALIEEQVDQTTWYVVIKTRI